jgi:hypothetical protein
VRRRQTCSPRSLTPSCRTPAPKRFPISPNAGLLGTRGHGGARSSVPRRDDQLPETRHRATSLLLAARLARRVGVDGYARLRRGCNPHAAIDHHYRSRSSARWISVGLWVRSPLGHRSTVDSPHQNVTGPPRWVIILSWAPSARLC